MKVLLLSVVSILRTVFALYALVVSLAAQEKGIKILGVPEELRDIPLSQARILDDINQDGRQDILFIDNNSVFISYQSSAGTYLPFEKIRIPLDGAVDFADILSGGEKEICVMHSQGVSCFQKRDGRWDMNPRTLVTIPTAYRDHGLMSLVRERFAIDLDGDHIPELILLDWRNLRFYRQDDSGAYVLAREFPLVMRTFIEYPGLKSAANPMSGVVDGGRYLWHKDWPVSAKYLEWTQKSTCGDILIGDVNHDSRLEFVQIERKEILTPGKRRSQYYEYRIHTLDGDKIFSKEPTQMVLDPYGVWASSTRVDIRGNGRRDLFTYQLETNGGLLQRPRVRLEFVLEPETGDYPATPTQTLETTDYPLGSDTLADVNGDGLKELALIHPVTMGFSLGSIIRKYVEKDVEIELRILPFKQNTGFTRAGMIAKRLKVSFFAGVPVSLAGDFNGDGAKDLLVIGADRLTFYSLNRETSSFLRMLSLDIKIPLGGTYEVIDLNGDRVSEIIFYQSDKISILWVNQNSQGAPTR